MSTQLLGAREEESRDDVTFVVSSVSLDSSSPNGPGLKERNYMGLSDCSSVDSSGISTASKESSNKGNLNLKATELRLGLPGSQSPERGLEHCHLSSTKHNERSLFPWHPLKDGDYSSSSQRSHVSGSKRGFSDAIEEKFCRDSNVNAMLSPRPSMAKPVKMKEVVMERAQITEDTSSNKIESKNNNSSLPAPKAQVAGWPPIRSFMKKTLATTSKDINEVNGKAGSSALFVKVSMDGAPYLRKVDLGAYTSYQELSSALEKKFSCFTIGQCGSQEAPGKEGLSESKLKDILCGSENVLTYEDKDGDWMLVGDVPWEMFINTCRRLRIMKSSDAIGLAPRAAEKMQESEVGRISSHA